MFLTMVIVLITHMEELYPTAKESKEMKSYMHQSNLSKAQSKVNKEGDDCSLMNFKYYYFHMKIDRY